MANCHLNDSAQTYKVYRIRNKVNGKCYYGLTKRPIHIRMTQHQGEARRGSKILISRAIAKHGWSAFEVVVLADGLTQEQACRLEVRLIDENDACGERGYNTSSGGQHGLSMRPETKERKSRAASEAWETSEAVRSAIHDPVRLRKISEASKRMHKNPKFRDAFMARHAVMVERSRSKECRARALNSFIQSGHGVAVRLDDGRFFRTASAAAEWVRSETKYKNASPSNILSCAKGKRRVAYGFVWSLAEIPDDGN